MYKFFKLVEPDQTHIINIDSILCIDSYDHRYERGVTFNSVITITATEPSEHLVYRYGEPINGHGGDGYNKKDYTRQSIVISRKIFSNKTVEELEKILADCGGGVYTPLGDDIPF